jgi:hypothetical protein
MEEKETPLDMHMSTSSKGVPRLPLVLRGNVHVTPLYVLVRAGRTVSARAGKVKFPRRPRHSPRSRYLSMEAAGWAYTVAILHVPTSLLSAEQSKGPKFIKKGRSIYETH